MITISYQHIRKIRFKEFTSFSIINYNATFVQQKLCLQEFVQAISSAMNVWRYKILYIAQFILASKRKRLAKAFFHKLCNVNAQFKPAIFQNIIEMMQYLKRDKHPLN